MPKENKPLKVIVEYCPSSDAEQRLQAAYEMIFSKVSEGSQAGGDVDMDLDQ